MNVVFYGSCQVNSIAKIFEKQGHSVQSYHIYEITDDVKYANLINSIKNADIFIHQNYKTTNSNNHHLQFSEIKKHIRSKTEIKSFPFIEFNGYFPDLTVDPRNEQTKSDKFIWGLFSPGLKCFAESFSFKEILYKLENNFYSKEMLLSFVDESLFRIKNREKETDIKVSDFIFDNYRKKRLFFTHTHYSSLMFNHMLTDLCKLLNLDIVLNDNNDMSGTILPIPNSIFGSLELEFEEGPCRWIGGKLCTRNEYIKKYCEIFDLDCSE